jgi:hypothetical protein
MVAMLICVVPKFRLDFSTLAAQQTGRVLLTPRVVDLSNFTQGEIILRIHALGTMAAASTITVKVVPAAPSGDDPGLLFWLPESAIATATIDSTTVAPSGDLGTMVLAQFSAKFGSGAYVIADGYLDSSPSTLSATISVCLALKGRRARRGWAKPVPAGGPRGAAAVLAPGTDRSRDQIPLSSGDGPAYTRAAFSQGDAAVSKSPVTLDQAVNLMSMQVTHKNIGRP